MRPSGRAKNPSDDLGASHCRMTVQAVALRNGQAARSELSFDAARRATAG
jgi:hypothetical protein